MDVERILNITEEQERLLRFKYIDFEIVKRISLSIADSLEKRKASAYIEAIINGNVVFSLALPGASRNNAEWVRRKSNLTSRYSQSSLRAYLSMRKNGKTLEGCGMDARDYGLSGGSFPILLEGGLCIGSITVSGMTESEDHQAVVDAIASEHGLSVPSVLS